MASRAIDPPNLKSSADSEIFLPAGWGIIAGIAGVIASRIAAPRPRFKSDSESANRPGRRILGNTIQFGHHVSAVTEPLSGVTVVSRRRSLPRSAGGDRDSGCKLEDHVGPPAPVTSRPGGPGLAGSEPST